MRQNMYSEFLNNYNQTRISQKTAIILQKCSSNKLQYLVFSIFKVHLTPKMFFYINELALWSKSAKKCLNLIKTSNFYALPKMFFECCAPAFWWVCPDETGYDISQDQTR